MAQVHYTVPDAPADYYLNPKRGFFSVIVPTKTDTVNICKNPSLELNANGYYSTVGVRTADDQRRGAWSWRVTPTAGFDSGFRYDDNIILTASKTYSYSLDFKGVAGLPYDLFVTPDGGLTRIAEKRIYGTGRWDRPWLTWSESSTGGGQREFYVFRVSSSDTQYFFVDGLQIEEGPVTTYIDGDQVGFTDDPSYPDYSWDGSPHESTSRRSRLSRAGGRVVRLADMGFRLRSHVGTGLPTPENIRLDYALIDGSQYQGSRTPTRTFVLSGDLSGTEPQMRQWRRALEDALGHDTVSPDQPLIIRYHPILEDYSLAGDLILDNDREIVCVYKSGLEGHRSNLANEKIDLEFEADDPFWLDTGDRGALLAFKDNPAWHGAGQRTGDGRFNDLGGGVAGGDASIYDIVVDRDGSYYLLGDYKEVGIGRGLTPAPSNVRVSASSGGTLAPGTYTYAITAYTYDGRETTISATAQQGLAAGQTAVNVAWDPVEGALGYKVYGRIGGSLGLLLDNALASNWTDTGALTPGAAPPSTNTTGLTANNVVHYDPVSRTFTRLGAGANNEVLTGAISPDRKIIIGGPFTGVGGLNPPSGLTASFIPVGGLTPGPYIYTVTAVNAFGETVAAAGVSIYTLPPSGSVYLSWNPVDGATSYKVYGRNAYGLLGSTAVTNFTDDGSITPGAAPPVTNTTYLPANRVARYDPVTKVWSTMGAGTGGGFNGTVRALRYSRDGVLWSGGDYTQTSAGVVLNYLSKYDPAGNLWLPLGTGANGAIWALEPGRTGSDMYAGGTNTTLNGVTVNRIALIQGGSTVVALGPGLDGSIQGIEVAMDGLVYVAYLGTRTGDNLITLNYIGQWNGFQWLPLRDGLTGLPNGITLSPDGLLYVIGSNAKPKNGPTVPGVVFVWTGSDWLPVDWTFDYFTWGAAFALVVQPGGRLTMSGDTDQNRVQTAGTTTINNRGGAETYPVIRIKGPGWITQIKNYTTGDGIYFDDLILSTGETITIDLTPTRKSFWSDYRGNIGSYIYLSDIATWRLIPGNNDISVYIEDSTADTSVTMVWRDRFKGTD